MLCHSLCDFAGGLHTEHEQDGKKNHFAEYPYLTLSLLRVKDIKIQEKIPNFIL